MLIYAFVDDRCAHGLTTNNHSSRWPSSNALDEHGIRQTGLMGRTGGVGQAGTSTYA